jgi:tRNA A-37 threonylcarbamoyl transferase component Bud32
LTTLATLLQGRLLADRYRIGDALGFGGMGAVFRAHDERLGRDVAVKVLTASSTDPREQQTLRARFRREARAAAALRHPNVVTVHDFGTEAGMDYLVMELLPGRDVAARLAESQVPPLLDEVLEIVREAACGLAAGHRAGVVHRDVKPRNLYLVADRAGGWEVKVLDFGIAQLPPGQSTESRLTQMGPSPHTPRYAAPEQHAGVTPLTPACDVYALGLLMLEMLAGRYPEGVNTAPDDTLAEAAIRSLVGVPQWVRDALARMLRRDPAQRPADADAVLRLLEPPKDASPPVAAPVAAPSYVPPSYTPPAPVYTPPAYTPPPPAPVPASAPAAPHAASAKGGEKKEKEAPRPPGPPITPGRWGAGVVILTVLGIVWTNRGAEPTRDAGPPPAAVATAPAPPPVPPAEAAARELAGQEAARAVRLRGGISFGEPLWLVVASVHPADELDRAAAVRDRLAGAGLPAGLASARVYPELPADSVAVVAGPFDRAAAQAALPAARRVAPPARVREVTFQMPR